MCAIPMAIPGPPFLGAAFLFVYLLAGCLTERPSGDQTTPLPGAQRASPPGDAFLVEGSSETDSPEPTDIYQPTTARALWVR